MNVIIYNTLIRKIQIYRDFGVSTMNSLQAFRVQTSNALLKGYEKLKKIEAAD